MLTASQKVHLCPDRSGFIFHRCGVPYVRLTPQDSRAPDDGISLRSTCIWSFLLCRPPDGFLRFHKKRIVNYSISVSMIHPISAQGFPEPQISTEPIRKPLRQPTAKPTIDKTIIQKGDAARKHSDPEPMVKKAQDGADKSGETTKAGLPWPEAVSPMTLPDVPEGYSSAEPVADIAQQDASEVGEDQAVSIPEETGNEESNIYSVLKKAEPRKAVITYARPEYKKTLHHVIPGLPEGEAIKDGPTSRSRS